MIISYEGQNIQLPDFLIPGATRAGTTALFEHLRNHPDVIRDRLQRSLDIWRDSVLMQEAPE